MQDPRTIKPICGGTKPDGAWAMVRCCLNPRVLIGLSAVAVGIALIKPSLLGYFAPILIGLVCPLSMALMMIVMMRMGNASSRANADDTELASLRARIRQLECSRPEITSRKVQESIEAQIVQRVEDT